MKEIAYIQGLREEIDFLNMDESARMEYFQRGIAQLERRLMGLEKWVNERTRMQRNR